MAIYYLLIKLSGVYVLTKAKSTNLALGGKAQNKSLGFNKNLPAKRFPALKKYIPTHLCN